MFFGNMQSFYRRNSIHNQPPRRTSSGGTQLPKDHGRRTRDGIRRHQGGEEEDPKSEETADEIRRREIPVIKIGVYNKPETALKYPQGAFVEKQGTVPCRNSIEFDNSVRLGPNKNNIIEESLRLDRERQKL